jgi:tetratricopeptide (TPR) repeat protein
MPVRRQTFSQHKEWNGLRIRTIEQIAVDSDSSIWHSSTHVAFVGDAAIITPDLATLRELLANANNETDRQLANNEAYRNAVKLPGDIVYFSDFEAVMADAAATSKRSDDFKISESGSLTIGGASWENNHHLSFKDSGWAKPFLPFDPKELQAPRELLPASTIGYLLINVDVAALWDSQLKTLLLDGGSPVAQAEWAIDFEKEVLPELGPECGAVLLDLPDKELENGLWAGFCRLKSNKLADALTAGKLFAGVGPASEAADKTQIISELVTIRNGFLIVSNDKKGLAAFDGKGYLAAARDYSRAVEKVPGGIVAFGGYNLEAAIAAANKTPLEGVQAELARVLSSIASAFHSQSFFATASAGTVEARSSVAMDREGRYPVADLSFLPRGANITLVALDPSGVPITDQKRLSSLLLRIRAKAPGPIDNIRDDIKTADQSVEQKSANELLVTVPARRNVVEKAVQLPVKDPQFAEHLKTTSQISADDKNVIELAQKIAGDDRDAWSVARKLADWTYQNLEWKLVASASVGDTLATREADCSEFSQLFVAMARSLGLPARMVSGLAYSGNSFGGHAWVEVWVGKWVELDPTWGTDFVDATHIRNNSDALVTSAALNLIQLEVVEAKRTVSEFQKSSQALTQHLLRAIPTGDQSDLEAALDPQVLTDEFMGHGAWSKMNEAEHEQMWSAYRRLLAEIVGAYRGDGSVYSKLRLLHHEEKDNVAHVTALLGPSDVLLKLRLVRRNDAWSLVEIVESDMAFRTVYETLQPSIASIEKTRSGQKAGPISLTDYSRAVVLLRKDAEKALTFVDAALKKNSGDQGLRYMKALALLKLEKEEEALQLLRELSDDSFPAAIHKQADILSYSEDENKLREALELYERLIQLEPYDSRAYNEAASMYDSLDNLVAAEAALRKVVELNPGEGYGYRELIIFLATHDKLPEVRSVLVAADKNNDVEEDLFGIVISDLFLAEEPKTAQVLAAGEPERLETSAIANLILGRIHFAEKKYAAALERLNFSAQLDKTATGPHLLISQIHRKQSRLNAALKAAQHAISLDAEDSEGHYQLACVLARMGKLKAAMAALEKAVELDAFQVEYMTDEEDLKPLASMPAFKKLLPEPAKP